jgi:hypothetical protein
MRFLFVLAFFTLSTSVLHAQFGINASYRFNDATDWQLQRIGDTDRNIDILANGPAFGVDYWFRLKNVRIEFLPELNYAQFTTDEILDFEASYYSFFLNTNFYVFDFKGDCDCPTWSKEGPTLEKGLFLQLSPGVSYMEQAVNDDRTLLESSAFSFSVGAGIGFDIGVSDFFTVTPMVGARYFLPTTWEDLDTLDTEAPGFTVETNESANLQFHAGLRLGFRFDY